jgi:Cof subfamily protein (haloacid dehalogenase superfamily)
MSDNQKQIKLIVTDVDGTLLNSDHQLPERNIAVLKAAAEQGVKIALATGKTHGSVQGTIEQLGIPVYGIYLQGMMIMDAEGKVYSQQSLHPDVARQVLTFAEERGFAFIAFSGSRTLARQITDLIREYTLPYHEPLPELVGPLQNILWTTTIHKLIAVGEPRAITGLRWQLNTMLGGKAKITQAGIPFMVEILPPGGGKASALKTLLKELHIAPENVLALGDAENDIEMLQMAGVGVAMGNADDKTKAAADYVAASNNDGGFAEAIERYVLPKAEATPEPVKAEGA